MPSEFLDYPQYSEFIPNGFQEQFIIDVHKMIVWGHNDAREKIELDTPEEHITGHIGDFIEELLDNESDKFKQGRYYSLSEESPVRDNSNKKGKQRQRNDLLFKFNDNQPRVKFIFEAKRLKSNSHEIAAYLGNDGLQRFIRGDYARNSTYAGMLGYVQTEDSKHWTGKLQKSFAKKYQDSKLTETKVIEEIFGEHISIHKRKSIKQDILIFHILLDFT